MEDKIAKHGCMFIWVLLFSSNLAIDDRNAFVDPACNCIPLPHPNVPHSRTPPSGNHVGHPTAPIVSGSPHIPAPAHPILPDPNAAFNGTCNYWRTHPSVIWGIFGWCPTIGVAFGVPSAPSVSNLNLVDALSNKLAGGLGDLYREATASLLNSIVNKRFHFTTSQVRDMFVKAVGTDRYAVEQANIFKLANEGKL